MYKCMYMQNYFNDFGPGRLVDKDFRTVRYSKLSVVSRVVSNQG